jgi:ADP-heptose:LPS heptosyltransferase
MSKGPKRTFKDRTRHVRKLLVVDFGFLGDSVQLLPTLWEVKRHHPAAELHVLTTHVGGEVLRMAACVDQVWDMELVRERRTLGEQLRLVRELRRQRFDAALNFSGSDRTVFWTWFSGARLRAAAAWGKHHFWTGWIIPHLAPPQDPALPIAEQRRGVLAALGFESEPPRYDLTPDRLARGRALELVPEGAVHVSVNAAKPLKEWPLEHYVELLKHLFNQVPELRVVASGSSLEREQQRLAQLAAAVNSPGFTRLPATMSIPELTAVLQRCRMHIGPDSGVMNLASALGIPTVSFFRNQPGYESWVPKGEIHQVFVGECHCVDHADAPCLRSGRADCLGAIDPATVFRAILERLGHTPPDAAPE